MAMHRRRKSGILYLVFGAVWLAFWAIGWAVAAGDRMHWWSLVMAVAWLASGSFELWRYRRQAAAFMHEDGVTPAAEATSPQTGPAPRQSVDPIQ